MALRRRKRLDGAKKECYPILHKTNDRRNAVKTGKYIRYEKEFDESFGYDGGDLGARCTKEGTVFKVWSPLADRVELHLYAADYAKAYRTCELTPGEKGVFCWETKEDLHGVYYDYTVYRGKEAVRTADPYAIACGCNGERSMVVDLRRTDPEGFDEDKPPKRAPETIIYELHIKDFSYDKDSGIPEEYRGKYKAFTCSSSNEKYPTCVEYLRELGITHVHLLPAYDFGSVDEGGADDQFNWGYDPQNYNVPEGSYATDPHDGAVRIREFKEMVQALHKNGIRVVMDVVYNHTYQPDSWLERMVPGYYNRRTADGALSSGSACGNDIAAGRRMVDNYIVDSVLYWAKEYHIDGFRFDLMGLLTVELMNRIRRELDAAYGSGEKLLYGEPWRASESPMEAGTLPALKENVRYLDEGIAVFSDDTRDIIKGHVFDEKAPGFVNGGTGLEESVLAAVTGWCKGEQKENRVAPKSCAQIVNYVSAHDNFTLWDKLVLTLHDAVAKNNEYAAAPEKKGDDTVYLRRYEDVFAANKLAALLYFTCQGHLFMQAGEEFARTKLGDGNSFRSAPEINMLRWSRTKEYGDLLAYYKGLIRLRKKLPGLCDKSAAAADRIFSEKIWGAGVVSFEVDNRGWDNGIYEIPEKERWERLMIMYNASGEAAEIALPDGDFCVLADGEETDCRRPVECRKPGFVTVAPHSGMILGR